MQTQTKQVAFTQANVDRCRCTACPVQTSSGCVSQKAQAMEGRGIGGTRQQDVPNAYCAQGTASCGDLDFAQRCVCPTCEVWQENGLGNYKYCQNGSAERIG